MSEGVNARAHLALHGAYCQDFPGLGSVALRGVRVWTCSVDRADGTTVSC